MAPKPVPLGWARPILASAVVIFYSSSLLAWRSPPATPPLQVVSNVGGSRPPRSPGSGLSGIWHSRYLHYSGGRDKELEGQHYVVLRQRGGRLIGQSLPHSAGSHLGLDLSVEAAIVTGTWTERTSPTGYYRGAVYHGTIQLVVNPMGRAMSGKWLGFGNNFKVNTREWELTWVDHAASPQALRKYHLKA